MWNDYVDFVIPLFELTYTDVSAHYYIDGVIHLKRGNHLGLQTRITVCGGKYYNSTKPGIAMNVMGTYDRINVVTFTYNGVKYCGIYVNKITANYYYAQFYGTCSNYDILSTINVYNNSTKTVLNSEIYNSLNFDDIHSIYGEAFLSNPSISVNGRDFSSVYRILHTGNFTISGTTLTINL